MIPREQTPLHMAALQASAGCTDLLIHFGSRVNATDSAGITALHIAATNGYARLVEKLIQGGADCDLWVPVCFAMNGYARLVEKLTQGGADYDL